MANLYALLNVLQEIVSFQREVSDLQYSMDGAQQDKVTAEEGRERLQTRLDVAQDELRTKQADLEQAERDLQVDMLF